MYGRSRRVSTVVRRTMRTAAVAIGLCLMQPATIYAGGGFSTPGILSLEMKTTTPVTLTPEQAEQIRQFYKEQAIHVGVSVATQLAVAELQAVGFVVAAGTLTVTAIVASILVGVLANPIIEAPDPNY